MTTRLSEHPTTVFDAPTETTAPAPAEWRGLARDEVRLLVASPDGLSHARFRDLPDHLRPGDLVVVNNSATVNGEIDATWRDTPILLHVATRLPDEHRGGPDGDWVVELRSAPDAGRGILDAERGEEVAVAGTTLRLLAPYPHEDSSPTGEGNRLWRAHTDGDLRRLLDRWGQPIAYGYLDRRYPLSAYQSVFATRPGSAEMASAGRPFTERMVTRLVANGIAVAPITLHTGVSSQEAGEGPQAEWFEVPPATARLVTSTRANGGRVIAVGTTVTRALESAVVDGRAEAASGWTTHVVTPANPPRLVDGLVTGWHDPHASHLLLVEAVAGPRLTQASYDAAVASHYLWHEFGDSALLLRR